MVQKFLVVSGHDFRSKRKANLHFIASELAKVGHTSFFSIGFSEISILKGKDPRIGMDKFSNKIEMHDGIECYLWKTLVHPGNPQSRILQKISPLLFDAYIWSLPKLFWDWVARANVVLLESGLPAILIKSIRARFPEKNILYIASDDVDTIGVDPYISSQFSKQGSLVNGIRVPSRLLVNAMPKGAKVFYVPHGIDAEANESVGSSPYDSGLNAVSVGSMLFDPDFFEVACDAFPEITFHVIGCGLPRSALPEAVKYYPEMPHGDTLPFIKYADFGIAPYREAHAPYYLSDTSMKLMQYEFHSLPAVCPQFAVGSSRGRFGYDPAQPETILGAINSALASNREERPIMLNWHEVCARILNPEMYPDTAV